MIQAKTSKSGREYFRLGAESNPSLRRVGKKEKKIACPLLDVFPCGQVSNPRLYRLKLSYRNSAFRKTYPKFKLLLLIFDHSKK